jgi:hypothetical protein
MTASIGDRASWVIVTCDTDQVLRTVENLMCQRAGRRENDFAISNLLR